MAAESIYLSIYLSIYKSIYRPVYMVGRVHDLAQRIHQHTGTDTDTDVQAGRQARTRTRAHAHARTLASARARKGRVQSRQGPRDGAGAALTQPHCRRRVAAALPQPPPHPADDLRPTVHARFSS